MLDSLTASYLQQCYFVFNRHTIPTIYVTKITCCVPEEKHRNLPDLSKNQIKICAKQDLKSSPLDMITISKVCLWVLEYCWVNKVTTSDVKE